MSKQKEIAYILIVAAILVVVASCSASNRPIDELKYFGIPSSARDVVVSQKTKILLAGVSCSIAEAYPATNTIASIRGRLFELGYTLEGGEPAEFGPKVGIPNAGAGLCEIGFHEKWKDLKRSRGVFFSVEYHFQCAKDFYGSESLLFVKIFEYPN